MTSQTHDHDHDQGHDHGERARSAHGHDHDHGAPGHQHGPADYNTAFAIGVTLNVGFVITEVVFGTRAHSLALTADAGHNLGDVLGLVLAWGASVLARRGPTPRRTYGLRRLSILAALANAMFLLIAVGVIGVEATQRFRKPATVSTGIVMVVALLGIVINVGTALGFMAGRDKDLNIRGAFLHMLGDAAASAGVVIAGAVIAVTGWMWLDPAVSLALIALITIGTWGLLRDSLGLALDAVPRGIDPEAVSTYLGALPGVTEVHDLHIWGMSTTHVALTAHLIRPVGNDDDVILTETCRALRASFGIEHATIQIERGNGSHPCGLSELGVV